MRKALRIGMRRIFDPERHGMAFCPDCHDTGYVQNLKRQCCPKCGGFGWIRKETRTKGKTVFHISHVPDGEALWVTRLTSR